MSFTRFFENMLVRGKLIREKLQVNRETNKKVLKVLSLSKHFYTTKTVKIIDFVKLRAVSIWPWHAVKYGPLHIEVLEREKDIAVFKKQQCFDKKININVKILDD